MRIVIVEDEKPAAERISKLIRGLVPDCVIEKHLDSVRNSVNWLRNNDPPDLILMDVQLADGLCFEIFEKADIGVPVIFTTAYNEYALKAFKVNSIDYLLKPVDEQELKRAIDKYRKLHTEQRVHPQVLRNIMEMIRNPYKNRFVVRIGEHIKTVDTEDVAFFYSSEKNSFLRSVSGRDYDLDVSLDQLETDLNPEKFFRVSRKYIIALPHISDIISYSGNRLKVLLMDGKHEEILVSREKVSDFKNWLDK